MNSNEKSNSVNNDNEINQIKKDDLKKEDEHNQNMFYEDKYNFGWGQYSEITNGRFAMIGFAAIIIIELISNKSFLNWAGIIN